MLIGNDPYKPGVYESIASATGTGSSGTITFSSIPSTYASLQLRIISRDTNAATTVEGIKVRFNNDSATNYVRHTLKSDGTTASAVGNITQNGIFIETTPQSNTPANVVGAAIIDIHNYTSTTQNKTLRALAGADLNRTNAGLIGLTSGLWLNTNAITRIDILATASFSTQTQIALYGIRGA